MKTLISFLNEKAALDYSDDIGYRMYVKFDKEIPKQLRKNAEAIAYYFCKIPYVSVEGAYDIEWIVNGKVMDISVDTTKTASDDIGYRNPLPQLEDWLVNGTPIRKTGPEKGTRKFKGLGKQYAPTSITLGMN